MNSKIFLFLVISYANLTYFVVSSSKYEHFSDCSYYSIISEYMGVDNLTLICGENPGEFLYDDHFKCSNTPDGLIYDWTGRIDFQNCRFDSFETYFLQNFKFLHTLNISDLGLEKLEMKNLLESKNLLNFFASRNYLTEIPSLLFVNAANLRYADLSKNLIKSVMPLAFENAIGLEMLDLSENFITEFEEQSFKDQANLKMFNLSHNQINSLDLRSLSSRLLLSLDVSNNVLTTLIDHTFDNFIELKTLNLSFNPIGNLKVETFAYLSKLENLNLRETNISSIQLGTFSHQHKLIALDLSDNSLKVLEFNLFLPGCGDLRSLDLAGNQLTELTDFHNSLFPQLHEFGIENNRFNCTYLQGFMKSVDWKNISLIVDPRSIDTRQTNIRGIQCEKVSSDAVSVDGNSNQVSYGDLYIKYTFIFICIVNSAILIIFLCINRHRIFRRKRSVPVIQAEYKSELSPSQIVEYSNEKVLLK